MARRSFSFKDIAGDCRIESDIYPCFNRGELRHVGIRIHVPAALYNTYPYNASAYVWLQQLRKEINLFGIIEFPNLPVNPTNHTLAQRAPQQHGYSSNHYLTDLCQSPHHDTPPYPTAFWLNQSRRFSSTWVLGLEGLQKFTEYTRQHPNLDMTEVHKHLVPLSLQQQTGFLVNREPGLLLIDNSDYTHLYHARTCNFDALENHSGEITDTPLYAFSEIGLIHYIDTLDERRGSHDRDENDKAEMLAFMSREQKTHS